MSQFTYGGNTYSNSGTATIDDNGTFLVTETNADGQPHVLTAADLAFFLQEHQHTVMRQNAKLRRYYKGDHDKIRNVRGKAAWKPNNKLPINFPKKLVDTFDGYFAGTPVKVDVVPTGDNQQDVVAADKFLATFNKLNDVPQTIFQLAKETSIVGRAYAYLYQGPDSQTHLASLRGEDGFVIYSMNIDRTPLYAVRLVRMNPQTQTYIVDVMTADGIVEQFDVASLQINDEEPLGFEPVPISYGIVPMIEFNADDERMGLYEAALPVIDGIDLAISEKANDVSYFGDSMLEIINFNIADDDLHNLKDNRVFKGNSPADRPAEVKFLEKPSNDQTQENLLSRLVDYLYQTTGVVNIDDQDFTNAASGKSLDHKLLPMTNKADAKAAKFTESLMRLYGALLRFNGFEELVTNLRIKFIKTVPHSLTDEATALVSLVPVIEAGLLSKETALSLFSFIEDPAAELAKVRNEQEQAQMVMKPGSDDTGNLTE